MKNFGLSENEFAQLVKDLQQGRDTLFEKIFLGHFQDCVHYLENNCSATPADAYDVSMETLLQFRRLLLQGKVTYGNLRFLFTRMAMQLYWKWIKRSPQTDKIEGIEIADPSEDFDEESIQQLHQAWSKLGEVCQRLLKNFYYNGVQLIEIAKLQDKSDAAVRQEKKRCLAKLRALFFKG
ncbi:MAG: sigma-70 family RNA polymerase sigma factor [Bacteroidota bacterium]